jgi:hypothetical protein
MRFLPKFLRWAVPDLTLFIFKNESPDTSRQDAVAEKIQGLTEEQWGWVKQKYEEDAPLRKRASDTADAVSTAQLESMQKANAIGDEAAQDYRTIYRPLEVEAAREAAAYNTEEKRQEMAGKAKADVEQAFGDAQVIANRNLTRSGVNPGDPAFASASGELQRDHALALTFGANKARTDAETLGRALRSDVIATGRGVVGSQGSTVGLGINAGNAAVANGMQPVAISQSGVGMVQAGAGQAVNGLGTAANIFTRSSQTKADANASYNEAVAGAIGAGATLYGMKR